MVATAATTASVTVEMRHVGPRCFEATHASYPGVVGVGKTRRRAALDLFEKAGRR